MNNANTLEFAMAMINNLGAADPEKAALMALQLHQHEQLLVRLDRAAEGVAGLVAANIAAQSARASAREEREERESAARINEITARADREVNDNRRHQEDHEVRMAEIRARHAARDQINRL